MSETRSFYSVNLRRPVLVTIISDAPLDRQGKKWLWVRPVAVSDDGGNILAWASAGSLGFNGPKKATPFASSKVIAAITEKLKSTGPMNVDILVKGVGGGRDSALRSLINQGFVVGSIRDITPIPHNGPRKKKVRRV